MRFDEMRAGRWDIARPHRRHGPRRRLRVALLPVVVPGFGGVRLQGHADQELALATVTGVERLAPRGVGGLVPRPDHPVQIAWLNDPEVAADEVRRERGARLQGGELPRAPGSARLRPLARRTGIRSARVRGDRNGGVPAHGRRALPARRRTRRSQSAALFGRLRDDDRGRLVVRAYAVRFPRMKIVLGEGGIGWVDGCSTASTTPMLPRVHARAGATDMSPAEVLLRNFWFCTLDDPSTFAASASASRTSCWRSTTRTPIRGGPTPRTRRWRRRGPNGSDLRA